MTDVTRDQRLLELLPAKMNDFYPLSEFYRDFTNFQVNKKDFSKTLRFEDMSYRFLENEISDIFKIHIIHSKSQVFNVSLTFFQYSSLRKKGHRKKERKKERETLEDIFYSYLLQNETEVFTIEEKISNRYKKNMLHCQWSRSI